MKKSIVCLIMLGCLLCSCASPADWQTRYDLGHKYLDSGDYKEAVLAFTEAIRIDSDKASAYLGRGDAYAKMAESYPDDYQQDYSLAEQDYLKAIELDGKDAAGYQSAGDLYISQGKYTKAAGIMAEGAKNTGSAKLKELAGELSDGEYVIETDGNKYLTACKQVLDENFGVHTGKDSYFMMFASKEDAWGESREGKIEELIPSDTFSDGICADRPYNGMYIDPAGALCYPIDNFVSVSQLTASLSRWMDKSLFEQELAADILDYGGKIYICYGSRGYGCITIDRFEKAVWRKTNNGGYLVTLGLYGEGTLIGKAEISLEEGTDGLRIVSLKETYSSN